MAPNRAEGDSMLGVAPRRIRGLLLAFLSAAVVATGLVVPSAAGATTTPVDANSSNLSAKGITILTTGPTVLEAGTMSQLSYSIKNGSPGTLPGSSSAPSAVLSDVVPPGLTNWSAVGTGWTCKNVSGVEACTLSSSIPAGSTSPVLRVTFSIPRGLPVTHASHPKAQVVNWTLLAGVALGGGKAVEGSVAESVTIEPRPGSALALQLGTTGTNVAMPGQTVGIRVIHRAPAGLTSAMTDTITLPAGTSMGPVSSRGWTCPAGSGTVTCHLTGTAAKDANGRSILDLAVKVGDTAADGVLNLKASSTSDDGEQSATGKTVFFVLSFGGPRLSIQRTATRSSSSAVSDGGRLPLYQGRVSSAYYQVVNTGTKPISPGSVLNVTLSLTPTAKRIAAAAADQGLTGELVSLSAKGSTKCKLLATKSISCAIPLPSGLGVHESVAIDPLGVSDGALFRQIDSINGLGAAEQAAIQDGQLLSIRAAVNGAHGIPPAVSQILAVNEGAGESLEPRISLSAHLGVGRPAVTASVRVANLGSQATLARPVVTLSIPASVRATAVSNSRCTVADAVGGGQTVTCKTSERLGSSNSGQAHLSEAMTFALADVSAVSELDLRATVSDGLLGEVASTTITLHVADSALTTLGAVGNLHLSASALGGGLVADFSAPTGAPAGLSYRLVACQDEQMTIGCLTQSVTPGATVTGFSAGIMLWVRVDEVAPSGYRGTSSSVASITLPLTGIGPAAMTQRAPPSAPRTTPIAPSITDALANAMAPAPSMSVPPAVGKGFCDLVAMLNVASPPNPLSANLGGGVAVTLRGASLTGTNCANGAQISFTSATVNFNGVYSLTLTSGTINSTGLTTASATLSTPTSWGVTSLSATNFAITFGGTTGAWSVSLSGSFSASATFGLPAASGWTATTSISLVAYRGTTSGLSITSTASNGPNTLSITGSASTAGAFSVAISGQGSLGGVLITNLSGTWNSGSPFTVSATAVVAGANATVAVSYTSTSTWSLTASGKVTVLGAQCTVSGTIQQAAGSLSGSFAVQVNATLSNGMTVTSSASWTSSGGLTGNVQLGLGSAGTILGTISYTNSSLYAISVSGNLNLGGVTVTLTSATYGVGGSAPTPPVLAATGTITVAQTPVAISLSYVSASNFTLTATGTFSMFGTTATASGTLTASTGSGATATWSGSLTFSLGAQNAPANIASGFGVIFSVTWAPGAANGTLSGSGQFFAGSSSNLTASFSYTSPSVWSVAVTSGTIVLGGVTISSITGSYGSSCSQTGVCTTSPFVFNATIQVGGQTATIGASYTNDQTWSFSSGATITLFGTPVQLGGQIQSAAGTVTGSLNASVSATIVTGLSVSLQVGWTTTGGLTGTGTLTMGTAGTLTATVTYVSATNYTVTVTGSATVGGMTLSILAGSQYTPSGGLALVATITVAGSTLDVTMNYTSSNLWSMTAATGGTVSIWGTTFDASGSISYNASNSPKYAGSFNFEITSPITIAPGVVLNTASLSWNSTTAAVTGTASFALGDCSLALSASYTNSSNWTLTVTVGAAGTIQLAPGFSIAASAFSGTIADSNGQVAWQLTARASNLTLIDDAGVKVALSGITLSVGSSCPKILGQVVCPPGTGDTTYLGFAATLAVTPGAGLSAQTVSMSGVYGFQSHGFIFKAKISPISIGSGLITLSNTQITISYTPTGSQNTSGVNGVSVSGGGGGTPGTAGGFAVTLSGSITLTLPGDSMTVSAILTYAAGGFVVEADLPAGGTLGTTGAALTELAYVSSASQASPVTLTIGGITKTITAPGLYLGGTLPLPSWLVSMGVTPPNADVALIASFSGVNNFMVTAIMPVDLPIPMSGGADNPFAFTFTSFQVSLGMSPSGPIAAVAAVGAMGVSGTQGSGLSSGITVTLALSFSALSATVTGSISAQGSAATPVWANAFGIDGLNMIAFAVQVSITFGSGVPVPGLGLAATLNIAAGSELAQFLSEVGIDVAPGSGSSTSATSSTGQAVPITALINLQVTSPCLELSIGTPGGPTAVSIAQGALTATYASLVIAPDGCTVGVYTVAPGFGFAFDGTLFGVDVSFQAVVSLTGTVGFAGSLKVGSFTAGPVDLTGVQVCAAVNMTTASLAGTPCAGASGSAVFGFTGSITVFDVTLSMSGLFTATSMSLTGSLSPISIGGFSLSGAGGPTTPLVFCAYFSATGQAATITTPCSITAPSGSGPTFALSASGALWILGNSVSMDAQFTYANGSIESISIAGDLNITIGSVASLVGSFKFSSNSLTGSTVLGATGTLSLGNGALVATIAACPGNTPGLLITNTGFNLCAATLSVADVFTATLSGAFWWGTPPAGMTITSQAGTQIAAFDGAYYFSASNVSLNINTFSLTGSVAVGNVTGSGAQGDWASISAQIYLSDGASDPAIWLNGSFSSSAGTYSISGGANVSVAGTGFYFAASASNMNNQTAVSVSTSLTIGGSTIGSIQGSFTSSNGSVYGTLTASANFSPGGFSLGSVNLTISVQPTGDSVSLSGSVNLGILSGSLSTNVVTINGTVGFWTSISVSINIGVGTAGGALVLTNCTSAACSQLTSFSALLSGYFQDYSGTTYSFNPVNVAAGWSFSVGASGSTSSCSGWINTGLIQFQGCFSGSYSVTLMSWSPYLQFSLAADVAVNAQNLNVNTSCSGTWYEPWTWSCSTTSYWGSTYNVISLGASVDSQGNVSVSYAGVTLSFQI